MDSQKDLPFSAASPGSKKDKQPWTAKILVSLCLGLLLFYALTKAQSRIEYREPVNSEATAAAPSNHHVDYCDPYQFLMSTWEVGGIGNQMSMYASLLAVAAMSGYTPRISEDMYTLLAIPFPGISIRTDTSAVKNCTPGLYLDPSNLEQMEKFNVEHRYEIRHAQLVNYPNAIRLFNQARPIIRKEFTFNEKLQETAQAFLLDCKRSVSKPDVWFIGIHVRRTNYINHLNITEGGKPVTEEYFERAADKMEQILRQDFKYVTKLLFIVTSDDPGWCKEKLKFKNGQIFHSTDAKNDLDLNLRDLDMAIAANCNHTIYDYGTFGFWGAYLAGGYTILAQNMSSNKNTEVENVKAANLEHWELIEAFAHHDFSHDDRA